VPRLFLRFAVLTTLGLTVAAAVAAAIVRHAYAVQGEQRAIERARLITNVVLDGQLKPGDVVAPVTASRKRELERLFSRLVLDDTAQAAAIYSRNGVLTFSAGRFGSARNVRREQAVGATREREITARINTGTHGPRRVLTTYVPIATRDGGSRGVIAVERDYAPIAAAARRSALMIAGVLEGALIGLVLLLTPTLLRASRRIREQVTALDHLATHDELTKLPNRLGFRRALEFVSDPRAKAAVYLVDLNGFHEI